MVERLGSGRVLIKGQQRRERRGWGGSGWKESSEAMVPLAALPSPSGAPSISRLSLYNHQRKMKETGCCINTSAVHLRKMTALKCSKMPWKLLEKKGFATQAFLPPPLSSALSTPSCDHPTHTPRSTATVLVSELRLPVPPSGGRIPLRSRQAQQVSTPRTLISRPVYMLFPVPILLVTWLTLAGE